MKASTKSVVIFILGFVSCLVFVSRNQIASTVVREFDKMVIKTELCSIQESINMYTEMEQWDMVETYVKYRTDAREALSFYGE